MSSVRTQVREVPGHYIVSKWGACSAHACRPRKSWEVRLLQYSFSSALRVRSYFVFYSVSGEPWARATDQISLLSLAVRLYYNRVTSSVKLIFCWAVIVVDIVVYWFACIQCKPESNPKSNQIKRLSLRYWTKAENRRTGLLRQGRMVTLSHSENGKYNAQLWFVYWDWHWDFQHGHHRTRTCMSESRARFKLENASRLMCKKWASKPNPNAAMHPHANSVQENIQKHPHANPVQLSMTTCLSRISNASKVKTIPADSADDSRSTESGRKSHPRLQLTSICFVLSSSTPSIGRPREFLRFVTLRNEPIAGLRKVWESCHTCKRRSIYS